MFQIDELVVKLAALGSNMEAFTKVHHDENCRYCNSKLNEKINELVKHYFRISDVEVALCRLSDKL